MNVNIYGEEFEVNFFDADEMERIETAITKLDSRNQSTDYRGMPQSQAIRTQCGFIFDFFDEAFGDGAHDRIFKGKCDLMMALGAFEGFIKAKNASGNELVPLRDKYSPDRINSNRPQFQPPRPKNGKRKRHH